MADIGDMYANTTIAVVQRFQGNGVVKVTSRSRVDREAHDVSQVCSTFDFFLRDLLGDVLCCSEYVRGKFARELMCEYDRSCVDLRIVTIAETFGYSAFRIPVWGVPLFDLDKDRLAVFGVLRQPGRDVDDRAKSGVVRFDIAKATPAVKGSDPFGPAALENLCDLAFVLGPPPATTGYLDENTVGMVGRSKARRRDKDLKVRFLGGNKPKAG
jgi:hypothetical protein